MPLSAEQLATYYKDQISDSEIKPKRGDAIFAGLDYPRTWSGFVGQTKAIEQLRVAIASAKARKVRLDHGLLASGIHGVGKSTLATLVAAEFDVGLLVTSGPLTADDFYELAGTCEDRDIVFVDEAHLLVQRARNAADWLLPWMLERKVVLKGGKTVTTPDVTLIAATTDAGKFPDTLTSRFVLTPEITYYTDDEAAHIAFNLAQRMGVDIGTTFAGTTVDHARAIATAADKNPRAMRKILAQVRDLGYAYPDTRPNLEKAFDYAGVSADGLTLIARDVLLVLAQARGVTASIEYIQAKLGEPGPLKHAEKQLLQRGLMTIATGKGRMLTELGARRAYAEAQKRMEGAA